MAWTGHRPEKLASPTAARALVSETARRLLARLCREMPGREIRFISGGARGADQWAAEAALELGIPFDLYLPAPPAVLAACWSAGDRAALDALLPRAGRVSVLGGAGRLAPADYQRRNEAMVDACDLLVALFDGRPSGTGNTVAYARQVGRPLELVAPPASPGLRYVRGDLLLSRCGAIAHGVNLVGAMGAGVARQLAERYPGLLRGYREALRRGELTLGGVQVYQEADRVIINLATQPRPGPTAELAHVERALNALGELLRSGRLLVSGLALPVVGSGLGGLERAAVEPLIERALRDAPVPVEVYREYRPGAPAEEIGRPVVAPEPLVVARRAPEELGRRLSSPATTPFVLHGRRHASLEAFCQGLLPTKAAGADPTAGAFTYGGRRYPIGSPEHLALVEAALRAKLAQHPELARSLAATGERALCHPDRGEAFTAERFVAMLERARADLLAGRPLEPGGGRLLVGGVEAVREAARRYPGTVLRRASGPTAPGLPTVAGLMPSAGAPADVGAHLAAPPARDILARMVGWLAADPGRVVGLAVAAEHQSAVTAALRALAEPAGVLVEPVA